MDCNYISPMLDDDRFDTMNYSLKWRRDDCDDHFDFDFFAPQGLFTIPDDREPHRPAKDNQIPRTP